MNHGLSATTVEKIHKVLSLHPQVERAILYGSRAKGNFKPGSDIDLTLVGEGLAERIRGQIDEELDDLLLPYEFDLSVLDEITHAELLDHIKRVGVVFYEKQPLPA
ncbi:MAG: nucleotidyltransferase domain-containing protein [Verrucomicrobia bacterium]|nr:nucleotidyltransferase domain-containing protein [Verrucomicrobiota bacterium]